MQKKKVALSQNDNHIFMQLTPTFHPFDVAWFLQLVLHLDNVVTHDDVAKSIF